MAGWRQEACLKLMIVGFPSLPASNGDERVMIVVV